MFEIEKFRFVPNRFFTEEDQHSIPARILVDGVNSFDDFIVWADAEEIRVFDRVCDHNAGKIITRPDGSCVCPLHGWVFDPATGRYLNNQCSKQPLLTLRRKELNGEVSFSTPRKRRELEPFQSQYNVRIRFLNHACLVVQTPRYKFAIDPWIIGPAFCRGWWLANPSPADSFDELNTCNFIYISHNHPDHLHPQTLGLLDKNVTLLTAGFASRSTENYLAELGFSCVIPLSFDGSYVDGDHEFLFGAIKSGDFRDDSGFLFQAGGFSAIFSVDSNFCDFHRFPQSLTLLASSFAGGASGFPLCFQTLSQAQKQSVTTRNRNAIRAVNERMITKAKPAFFMPYAGMFKEIAARDSYILKHNIKNAIPDYLEICQKHGAGLLNVLEKPEHCFLGSQLVSSKTIEIDPMEDQDPGSYIAAAKMTFGLTDRERISQYFTASGFHGDLNLILTLCDDDFNALDEDNIWVEFRAHEQPRVDFRSTGPDLAEYHQTSRVNCLHIKARAEALRQVIDELLPWEDLLIGFQTQVNRVPDTYNSDFWYHFTNIYVKKTARRMAMSCNACEKINQAMV